MKSSKKMMKADLSRREFLKQGAAGLGSFALPPATLFELFRMQSAQAAGFTPFLPIYRFLHIHLSGGPGAWRLMGGAFASNIASTLSAQAMSAHGLVSARGASGVTDTLYGTTVLRPTGRGTGAGDSAFHNALYAQIAGTGAENRMSLLSAATTSPDDNASGTVYGMLPALSLAGFQGETASSLGQEANDTGNGTGQWVTNPSGQMIPVTRVGNVLRSIVFSNVLGNAGDPVLRKIAEGMKRLSDAQLKRLQGPSFAANAGAGYEAADRSANSALSADVLNATLNPDIRRIFGIAERTSTDNGLLNSGNIADRTATIVYNVMTGSAAAGSMVVGGLDYHDESKNSQDLKDTGAGALVGRCLAAANALSQGNGGPGLVLWVTQDGGNVGNSGFTSGSDPANTSLFVGDRRELCGSMVFLMDPVGRSTPVKKFFGTLLPNGQVDDRTPMGKDRMFSAMVFFSYLSLNGQASRADAVLSAAGFTSTEIALIKRPENVLFG